MAIKKDRYSKRIQRLKIICVLLALLVFSTIFTASYKEDAPKEENTAKIDLPNKDDLHEILGVEVSETLGKYGTLGVSAHNLRFDEKIRNLELRGEVRMKLTSGWQLGGDSFTLRLDTSELVSHAPVHIAGPLGKVDAGSLHAYKNPNHKDKYYIRFTDGVKLIYYPKR